MVIKSVPFLFLNYLCILRKVSIRDSDLSKNAPSTLLKSFRVMGKFLEMFQEFGKKSFPYKTVFQAYK